MTGYIYPVPEAYQPGTMRWRFGRREIEVEQVMKCRRQIDHDAEKILLPEQKLIAKNRSFHRKVAFILLVDLEPTLLASDKAGFL